MPIITFGIHNQPDTNIFHEKAALKSFLDAVFRNDEVLFDDIRSALLAFHQEDGGSPTVPDFEIIDCWYDGATKTGKVRFEYQVFFTYGCADLCPVQKSAETSKFSIDLTGSKLLLYVTDHISRDTLNEF